MEHAWLVYVLFAISGLLAGGTWSAYQAGNRLFTFILAIACALSGAAAILWLLGAQ
ncbi:hypothetical protein [Corynebacterium freiburgense]|uniref:hypothetical protein n=1 Tax=Corynebacterium freiburgense TaxID=556548 RepID=UPI000409C818|nr:hypothetical protein [Corynebacterium freiburgense]WJZ03095.1 hypothetical protein CFREI_09085 [Corynebacterium freiburgense]